MILVLGVWVFVRALLGSSAAVTLENVALRHQLAVLQRSVGRPRLRRWDRLVWVGLSQLWAGWRSTLVIVQPATVLAWHRQGFQLYWRWKSRRRSAGRPPLDLELRTLIRRMARENPTWGRRRIPAELRFLGYEVAELTIAKDMRRTSPRPSSTWRTFLEEHIGEIVAIDFFVVPTLHLPLALWLPDSSTQPSRTRPCQRYRPPRCRLDRPPIGRELSGRDRAQVPAPRSRCHLRRRVRTAGERPEDERGPHRRSGALAESFRPARHRFNSTRMLRSRHRDQRTASPTVAAQLPCVPQRHPPASVPPQPNPSSAHSTTASGRAHRRDSASRRPSPPLPARRLTAAGFSGYTPRWSRDGGWRGDLRRPSVVSTGPFPAAVQARRLGPHPETIWSSGASAKFVTGTPQELSRRHVPGARERFSAEGAREHRGACEASVLRKGLDRSAHPLSAGP